MEMKPNHFHYHPSSRQGNEHLVAETIGYNDASFPATLLEDIQIANRQSSFVSFLLVDQVLAMIRSG